MNAPFKLSNHWHPKPSRADCLHAIGCSQAGSFVTLMLDIDVLAERRLRLLDGSAQRLSWHEAKTRLQRLGD